MRMFITALLAGATLAAPLAAQDWQPRADRDGGGRPDARAERRPDLRAGAQPQQGQPGSRPDRDGGARGGDGQAQRRPDAPGDARGQYRGGVRNDTRVDDRGGPARDPRFGDDRVAQGPRPGFAAGERTPGRPDPRDRQRDERDRAGYRGGQADWNRGYGGRDERAHYGSNDARGWDRGWRDDRRYDWQDRRAGNRDRFRAPRYAPPRGYGAGYRRWSVGARLAPLFFAQSYWLNDTGYYGLPPAYGPYRWVRYYGDVLLVDIRTGYVADMIPAFFL